MRYPADEFVGRLVLGRYRIVGVLAKGGMGVIYLARSEGAAGFVKPVVIKRILTDLGDDSSMVSMFKREARIMSNLRHPGIVSVIDFGRDHRAYFMVLDYIHGFHLGRWLRYTQGTSGPFPVEFAIHIVIQVLDALHYAHTLTAHDGTVLQVVHRDVTPSNVLLDVEGHVKLADFGIARMRTDATDVGTGEATIKGKFPYLAPEILHGGDPSPVSDVYACGVVLHEALIGRNVFRAPNFSATVSRVLNHQPELLESVRQDIPPGLSDIINKALNKDATQRFQSALEFAQALRQMRTGNAEQTQAKLAEAVAKDFFDPHMSELLGADDLSDLDRAWREAPDTSSDFREAAYISSRPPPSDKFPSIPIVLSNEGEFGDDTDSVVVKGA
ncbi:MAG: serine/threonine protein kinase [Myxococcales bacterium]|nr:MAG: serine/threonine protein kinase [Myxococcales bacterium]